MLFVVAVVVDAQARFALLSSAATFFASSLRSTTPAKPPPPSPPTSIWRVGQGRRLGGMASRNPMRRARSRERCERGSNRLPRW